MALSVQMNSLRLIIIDDETKVEIGLDPHNLKQLKIWVFSHDFTEITGRQHAQKLLNQLIEETTVEIVEPD